MPDPVPDGLLLAAGGSERLGQPKQLLQLRGVTLVRAAAERLLGCCSAVVVVTGAHAREVGGELRGLGVKLVCNEDWRAGMGGSIAAGMGAVDAGAPGVLIHLCDLWRVEAADLERLCGFWARQPHQPVFAGRGGAFSPPAIFPRRMFGALRGLRGEEGARSLAGAGARFLDMPGARFDLDTPEDLRLFREGD